MVLGIQVFGLAFSAFILYMSFLYYKKKEFTPTEAGFWAFFGIVFGMVSLFPGLLSPLVESLSLGRTLDLFIILGFMFLIAVAFYTYRIARNSDRRTEELVRKIALEKDKEKEGK